MGSRVFVRLYDGARQVETDDVVMTLPPPPLKWASVLSAMVAAIDRADDDDADDADADPTAAVAPERIAKARLFLLPSESQGIVAEVCNVLIVEHAYSSLCSLCWLCVWFVCLHS